MHKLNLCFIRLSFLRIKYESYHSVVYIYVKELKIVFWIRYKDFKIVGREDFSLELKTAKSFVGTWATELE